MTSTGRMRRFAATPAGRQVAIALAVGLVLRVAWGFWALRSVPTGWLDNGDQYSYWYYGNEIAHGRGYLSYATGTASSYYPVGFPALLGAVYWLDIHLSLPFSQAHLTAMLNIVLSSASIVLTYFIARKTFTHRVGLVAAWLVALFPSLIFGVATYSIETTFLCALLVCVAVAVDHDWTSGPMGRKRMIGFAVSLGVSILIRPFSIPVFVGVAVAIWLVGGRWRALGRLVGWTALTVGLMLTPWTIRNERALHAFVPISTNLGDTLCLSRYPGSNGGFAWADHAYCGDSTLPDPERNTANTKAAIRFVLHNPGEELRQIPKRFFLLMGDDHSSLAESLDTGSNVTVPAHVHSLMELAADYFFYVVWFLATAGTGLLFLGWRRRRGAGARQAIVGITTVGLVIIPLLLWGNPRFHAPMIPFMAIMAAASIVWIADRRTVAKTDTAAERTALDAEHAEADHPQPAHVEEPTAAGVTRRRRQVPLVARTRRFATTRDGHRLIVVVAIGFVLRLVWGLWAQRRTPDSWITSGDQYGYWFYGNEIAHGRGYLSYINGRATAYYPVGYPALLGVVYWFGLHTPLPGNQAVLTALLHTLMGTASIVLVYFIGRKTFGHRAGLIAAAIVAVFPSLIIGVATFAVEPTFIFAALVCVAIVVDHDWATSAMSRRRLIGFGFALGLSLLIRPFAAPVLIGVVVAMLLAGDGWRGVARAAPAVLIPVVIVLTPWTIRNELRFDHFVPVSNNLGDTLCMSRFIGSNGGFAWADHQYCADPNMPEAERNPANTKGAIHFVLDHPAEELRQIPQRFQLMMANDHYAITDTVGNGSVVIDGGLRSAIDLASDYFFYAVWFVAMTGFGLLCIGWRRDRLHGPRRAIITITAAGLVVIPVGLWGVARFHAPILPFMAIVAGAALAWLTEQRQLRVAPTE